MEKERRDASFIDLLKKHSTVTILFINLLISREFQEYSLYKSILNYVITQFVNLKRYFSNYIPFSELFRIYVYIFVEKRIGFTWLNRNWPGRLFRGSRRPGAKYPLNADFCLN